MSDAPKRIWGYSSGIYPDYCEDGSEGEWFSENECGSTEYIRAEIVEGLVDALTSNLEAMTRFGIQGGAIPNATEALATYSEAIK